LLGQEIIRNYHKEGHPRCTLKIDRAYDSAN